MCVLKHSIIYLILCETVKLQNMNELLLTHNSPISKKTLKFNTAIIYEKKKKILLNY